MKRLVIGLCVAAVLSLAALLSVTGAPGIVSPGDLKISIGHTNPWTSLKINNKPRNFQFAIVSDNTGGRRPGVFTSAVTKINLLQPEFVISVGDLIDGYSSDPGQWAIEWAEFESTVDRLQMPFFFCPGNHDISNQPMSAEWHRKFGRSYYSFRYHDVLFLVLNTEDPPGKDRKYHISEAQRQFVRATLTENTDVRWTLVFLHKPPWVFGEEDPEGAGWSDVERALAGRKYTVFAGHVHEYATFSRLGMEYYTLATTGGGSELRGLGYGEFDHFVWVTMTDDGPVIANLLLDGVHNRKIHPRPVPIEEPKALNPGQ